MLGERIALNRFITRALPAEAWRRNLIALTAASFMSSVGFVFVMPLLPLLMAQLVGNEGSAATFWSGIAFGISPLLSAILSPVWGWVGDRYGFRLMLLRALASMGALMGVMGFAGSVLHLVGARAGLGALGAFFPAAMASVAAHTPRELTGRSIGLLQAAQVAGTVVGPLLGGILADRMGLRAPFLAVAGLFLVAFVIVFAIYRDLPSHRTQAEAHPAAAASGVRSLVALWLLWASLFAVSFGDSTFGPLLPLYLRSLGVPLESTASLTGLTVSLGAMGTAFSAYFAPRLGARRVITVIQFGLIGAAILNVPVGMASEWWQIPPLRAGVGLLGGAILTLSYTLGAQSAGPGRQGAVLGSLASASMFGWAAGPLAAAALSGAGPRVVFFANAAILGMCAIAWQLKRPASLAGRAPAAPPPARKNDEMAEDAVAEMATTDPAPEGVAR